MLLSCLIWFMKMYLRICASVSLFIKQTEVSTLNHEPM